MPKVIVIDGRLGVHQGRLVTDAGGAPCCCGGGGPCTASGAGCCFQRFGVCAGTGGGDRPSFCDCGERFRVDIVGHTEAQACSTPGGSACCAGTRVWDNQLSVQVPAASCDGPHRACVISSFRSVTATVEVPVAGVCTGGSASGVPIAPGLELSIPIDYGSWCGLNILGLHELGADGTSLLSEPVGGSCPGACIVYPPGVLPGIPPGTTQNACSFDSGFYTPLTFSYQHRILWSASWGCYAGSYHYEFYKRGTTDGNFCCSNTFPFEYRRISDVTWTLTRLSDCDVPLDQRSLPSPAEFMRQNARGTLQLLGVG